VGGSNVHPAATATGGAPRSPDLGTGQVADKDQPPPALNGRGRVLCSTCVGNDPLCRACLGTGIEGTTVVFEVRVCLGPDGRLWSSHQPATPADGALQLTFPGGGHRHVANGLLTEAIRREAFVCLLLSMTRQADFLTAYVAADGVERNRILGALVNEVSQSLVTSLGPMVLPAVKEALAMVLAQFPRTS